MALDECLPGPVAQRRVPRRRADKVGEQDGGQNGVECRRCGDAANCSDQPQERINCKAGSSCDDVNGRVWHERRDVARLIDALECSSEYGSRRLDERQQRPHVGFVLDAVDLARCIGRRAVADDAAINVDVLRPVCDSRHIARHVQAFCGSEVSQPPRLLAWAPVRRRSFLALVVVGFRLAPRIVGGPGALRDRIVPNQSCDTLGVRCSDKNVRR